MNILYDENIPFGKEAFSTLGDVQSSPGREITANMLKNVDLLFVRSVTKVKPELLEGNNVKFVATATSGSDHIDKTYLAKKNIFFKDAIGSNANSVAEYVSTALLILEEKYNFKLDGKSIGIIGVGHVGSLVAKKTAALGLKCLMNDPPRERNESDFYGVSLEKALSADIVTFHVPLTFEGLDPTFHLLNEKNISLLKTNCILLQTSRGPVAETFALKNLKINKKATLVLDVWENEPNIDPELFSLAEIATPHIAGYSWTSKVEATNIVYKAACEFLKREPLWKPPTLPENYDPPIISINKNQSFLEIMKNVCDIDGDNYRMQEACSSPKEILGKNFDILRKTYPIRLEAQQFEIKNTPKEMFAILEKFGFKVRSTY